MESTHRRQLRYYQGQGHPFYNQYQPSFSPKEASLWRSHPLPPPEASRRRRWGQRQWCNMLLAAAAFLVVLTVMVIAGLAIYMGALKLEASQYLVLDGSFRVVSGDSYNASLSDHSNQLFQRKSQVYKLMIESIFRRSDLGPAVKQCSVLGFANNSLVVFFRLILDRRKIPKGPLSIEEQVKTILLQGVSATKSIKNLKIDQADVFLKSIVNETNNTALPEDVTSRNQTVEIHNGLLRKSFPRIVTAHYTSTPPSVAQIPKTSSSNDGVIEGTFKLSTSQPSKKEQIANQTSYVLAHQSPASSHEHQKINRTSTKSLRNDSPVSIDFFQHSPALNALVAQKPRTEKVKKSSSTPTTTESAMNYADTDLITLLPYVFQGQEEPWKPILPENFTRYPERRPFATEGYSSEGVGVVEVVLDPEDLTSPTSSNSRWSKKGVNVKNHDFMNLDNPHHTVEHSSPVKYENDMFGPRSDEKTTSFLLNMQSEKNKGEYQHYDKVHGDIFTRHKNIPILGDITPDFPIIQQFHNLDSFLRSYRKSSQKQIPPGTPVTLLPARSNIDMRKRIRPRPSQTPQPFYSELLPIKESEETTNNTKIINSQVQFEVEPATDQNEEKQTDFGSFHEDTDAIFEENATAAVVENNALKTQSQSPVDLLKDEAVMEQIFDMTRDSDKAVDLETITQTDGVNFVEILKTRDIHTELTPSFEANTETKYALEDKEFIELTTADISDGVSPRNHRQSKMSNTFHIAEDPPLKFDLASNDKGIQLVSNLPATNTSDLKHKGIANQSVFVMKLKDIKFQELLEEIIYNLTTENPKLRANSSEEFYIDIAHNRKYGQSSADNKNSLIKNSTFFEMKPDIMLYHLKHPKNVSSSNFQTDSNTNGYLNIKNGNSNNKTSSNYILNKDGFLMLTKVYNKAPNDPQTNKDENPNKSLSTGNHTTDCSGSLKMRCGSGECINSLSRCNNLVDCADGSDEKNCSCAEFLRAQYLTRKICDGVVDCWDFSDENNCDWCSSGQYVCSNSRVCIDLVHVCDGDVHCPNGDDEKNCVSIAPNVSQADSMNYYSSGTLMIRKEGQWGKLCTQNFANLSSLFQSRWTLDDLGKVVCKTMTFRFFDSIESVNDTNDGEINQNTYYELIYSNDAAHQPHRSRLGLTFQDTDCTEKNVVRITCRNLECGVRPQANTQWARTKRVTGSRHSRIVGGGNAGPGSWPWLAALYKEGEFQCGATLISDQWLLSAGHCFYHALDDYWVARLGALRRGTNLPSPYEQLRVVSRILLHPNYVDSGFINDISLLQMERPVSLTNYVRPICLPQPNAILRDGKMCTVIGWGQLFEIGRIFPDTLQEVQLPVISTSECRKRTLFLPLYKVTENMFCAGYDRGGRDACLGDSGGPLMCQESDGHWSLMGVTSNGYGCARANRPGVYTKVANYVNWVHTSMADESKNGHVGRLNSTCHGHRCPLGECLPPARICNGYIECSDGSDERDCW